MNRRSRVLAAVAVTIALVLIGSAAWRPNAVDSRLWLVAAQNVGDGMHRVDTVPTAWLEHNVSEGPLLGVIVASCHVQ
ncbi:MAG: hypothetical protein RL490_1719, partial [Pseudomonadota bacterium]